MTLADENPPADAPLRGLLVALRRIDPAFGEGNASVYRVCGFIPETVTALERLAAWAATRSTGGTALPLSKKGPRTEREIAQRLLFTTGAAVRFRGLPLPIALDWAAVLAAAPTLDNYEVLSYLLNSAKEVGALFAPWVALGEFGPPAYAAGLDLDEAQAWLSERPDRTAADQQELLALAALRGWLVPIIAV